jgi:hypothetical protein
VQKKLLYKSVDLIVHKVGEAVEDNVQAEEKIYRNLITTVMNLKMMKNFVHITSVMQLTHKFMIITMGKSGAAVQPIIAVRHSTAKTCLPFAARSTHDKVTGWCTAKLQSTANSSVPNGNVPSHGKVSQKRTAKKPGRQSQ